MEQGGRTMKKYIKAYWEQRDGATAVEYALIASGIAAAIAATVYLLGDSMLAMYLQISASFGGS